MVFHYNLDGSVGTLIREMTVYGTTISEGALVCAGITTGTNFGGVVVAPSGLANVVGVIYQAIPGVNSSTVFPQTPSVQATPTVLYHKVIVNPLAVYLIEYSQTTTDTVTAVYSSSAATITGTSTEDLTGGFLYDITTGLLTAIKSFTTNTLTAYASLATAIASTDYCLKIHRNVGAIGTNLIDLNTTATLIGGTGQAQAAAGTGVMTVWDTYIQADTIPFQKLNPVLHNGLNLLNKHPRFFADVSFTTHLAFRAS